MVPAACAEAGTVWDSAAAPRVVKPKKSGRFIPSGMVGPHFLVLARITPAPGWQSRLRRDPLDKKLLTVAGLPTPGKRILRRANSIGTARRSWVTYFVSHF